MTKPPKRPRDPNQLAKFIADLATSEGEPGSMDRTPEPAVRGRPGGLTGGRARADKLSPERRSEIAKAAAAKRWKTPQS